jgi:membrane-associated phospholipid phosphatase
MVGMAHRSRSGRRGDLAKAGACAAALTAMSLVARDGLSPLEETVFLWVHALPNGLEPVVWLPMQAGTAVAPFVVAAAAATAWRDPRPAIDAIVVGLGGWYLAKGVKALVDRGRPGSFLKGLRQRASTPTDGLGYVSGHTTVAFGLATVLSPVLTRSGKFAVFGLATVVAASRVYVGAHLPLDVIGGGLLGTLLGWLWYLAAGEPARRIASR